MVFDVAVRLTAGRLGDISRWDTARAVLPPYGGGRRVFLHCGPVMSWYCGRIGGAR